MTQRAAVVAEVNNDKALLFPTGMCVNGEGMVNRNWFVGKCRRV